MCICPTKLLLKRFETSLGTWTTVFARICPREVPLREFDKGGGQILLVTTGRGYYQEWGKPARALKAGDIVNIPSEVKHWHGAAPDSWFQHLAIEVPGENCRNEWCEPVSDEEFNFLPKTNFT